MNTARLFRSRSGRALALAVAAFFAMTGCSSSTSTAPPSNAAATSAGGNSAAGSATDVGAETGTLRLGYFANLTHAAAVLGVADGTFQSSLGATKLETSIFNAGPAAIEALTGGAIDAAYLGPSPAINSYAKSDGDSLRIVAGATDNGAALVVRDGITSAADLKGKTIATPQLGGTQDVALRKWLLDNGLTVQTTGGDDVNVASQDNSQTLDLFKSGQVDGGWLPEPWASRLVVEAGAHVLVDETSLWPDGKFPTTILVVSRTFLEQYPGTVAKLLSGQLTELDAIDSNPADAQTRLNKALGDISGKPLADGVIAAAFAQIHTGFDPLAGHFGQLSQNGVTAGTLTELPKLDNLFDLRILNKLLKADGKTPVSAAGLGQE